MAIPEIRIALVGFGSIARTHLSALAALPAVRALPLRPVVDTIVSSRAAAIGDEAAALGVRRVVPSVEEALDDAGLAVVDVTSRNDRHLADAAAALGAGRHLYLEKPLGRTVAEAARIVDLAAAAGGVTQAGLALRYHPSVVEARALLRAGALGELRQLRLGSFHGSYLDPARPVSWRLQAAQAGGGAMLDLGVHLLDAARFMAGEPVLRAARAHTAVTTRPGADHSRVPVDVDDWAWAELELPGGAWLTVEASRLSLGAEGQPFEAYGSEGSLVGDLAAGSLALRRFDSDEAAWRAQAARDPLVLAAAALRPPPRLTLGSFVDAHAASLLHHLLRSEGLPALVGGSAADELAPSLADALAAERLAHAIIEAAEPAAPSAATD